MDMYLFSLHRPAVVFFSFSFFLAKLGQKREIKYQKFENESVVLRFSISRSEKKKLKLKLPDSYTVFGFPAYIYIYKRMIKDLYFIFGL